MKDIIERLRERHTAQYPMPGGPSLFTEAADALAEARAQIKDIDYARSKVQARHDRLVAQIAAKDTALDVLAERIKFAEAQLAHAKAERGELRDEDQELKDVLMMPFAQLFKKGEPNG